MRARRRPRTPSGTESSQYQPRALPGTDPGRALGLPRERPTSVAPHVLAVGGHHPSRTGGRRTAITVSASRCPRSPGPPRPAGVDRVGVERRTLVTVVIDVPRRRSDQRRYRQPPHVLVAAEPVTTTAVHRRGLPMMSTCLLRPISIRPVSRVLLAALRSQPRTHRRPAPISLDRRVPHEQDDSG